MISAVTASPSKATTSSQPPRDPNEVIFARFVARLEEAGEEDLETLGVEGVDPTLAVMEWADGLRDQVSMALWCIVSGLSDDVCIVINVVGRNEEGEGTIDPGHVRPIRDPLEEAGNTGRRD